MPTPCSFREVFGGDRLKVPVWGGKRRSRQANNPNAADGRKPLEHRERELPPLIWGVSWLELMSDGENDK